MNLHSLIVDEFLQDFERWRSWLDSAVFADVESPVDGVIYPNICSELPDELRAEVLYKIQAWGSATRLDWLFARLSPLGVRPPHWAHNDASMGTRSMMLYMNRREHCRGGTALLEHRETGCAVDEATWRRDTNDHTKWRPTMTCPMRSNRAFIFPAHQWHAALPARGFGLTAADARLVITAFFQ